MAETADLPYRPMLAILARDTFSTVEGSQMTVLLCSHRFDMHENVFRLGPKLMVTHHIDPLAPGVLEPGLTAQLLFAQLSLRGMGMESFRYTIVCVGMLILVRNQSFGIPFGAP
jgi:hypothetical protein